MKSYANKWGCISSEWKAKALYGAEVSKASQLNKRDVVFDFEIAAKQLIVLLFLVTFMPSLVWS